MDVNEPLGDFPIGKTKIKSTYCARAAVSLDAPYTGNRTALVGLDDFLTNRAFHQYFG